MATANNGDTVKVHLKGTISDGRVFEPTDDGDPVQFTIGRGEVLPGIEDAVIGMATGEHKQVSLPPDLAFGERKQELVFSEQRSSMPEDLEVMEGMELLVESPEGVRMPLRVVKLEGDMVELDANHPLAGNTLELEIELVEIVEQGIVN